MKDIFTEPVRAYIYRVLIALGSCAIIWGLVTGEQLAAILGAVAAVLNIMPAMNTTTKTDEP
jgi:inner membrane protein involved in colicin E2 resistance